MHVVWINEHASFIGGCEQYIFQTVQLLKTQHIRSTLLYNPLLPTERAFLSGFDQAFPLLRIQEQIPHLKPNVLFIHQLFADHWLDEIPQIQAPIFKFVHDYWLLCLNRTKLPLWSNKACCCPPTSHCSPFSFSIARKPLGKGWMLSTKAGLKTSQQKHMHLDGIIVPSRYMAEQLKKSGFPPQIISCIPLYALPPTLPETRITKDTEQLLYVGQIIRGKGVDTLIHALRQTHFPFKLTLIGDGRQRKKYESLVQHLGLSNRVKFLGWRPSQEVEEWYQRAMCLILPARRPEPFGLVGPEAMRFQTPTIATYPGGTTEWLEEGQTGFLIPPNNSHALAHALNTLYEKPTLWKRFSEQSQKNYESTFRPHFHIEKLLTVFQKTIDQKQRTLKKEWTHLSVYGSPDLEKHLFQILTDIQTAVSSLIERKYIAALVLAGGFGRSEGGIEIINGLQYPHNDFDLVLITQKMTKKQLQESQNILNACLKKIAYQQKFDIHISLIDLKKLRSSKPLLMWYEMTHGSKILLGDKKIVPSLPFKEFTDIDPQDIWQLMLNRSSLLILNDWMISQKPFLTEKEKKIIIKHRMQAILGIGDAWLFFHGQFHWSYLKRKELMRQSPLAPSLLKDLYLMASSFRLQPDYTSYLSQNMQEENNSLKIHLSPLFLACEAIRLKKENLTWENYYTTFFKHPSSPSHSMQGKAIDCLKKIRNILSLFRNNRVKWADFPLRFFLSSPKQRLGAITPVLAFSIQDSLWIEKACLYLTGKPHATHTHLTSSYLADWAKQCDPSLIAMLEELQFSLPHSTHHQVNS